MNPKEKAEALIAFYLNKTKRSLDDEVFLYDIDLAKKRALIDVSKVLNNDHLYTETFIYYSEVKKEIMKTVLVIVEYDYSDKERSVIGVASDRENALLIIRDYYGKDAVESKFIDYRESGIDFSLTIEVDDEEFRITAMDFEIDQL